MNRRDFLKRLIGGTAAAVVAHEFDLERLLWVPGEKTIFLPSAPAWPFDEPLGGGNVFLTPEWIARDVAQRWLANIRFVARVDREYDARSF